MTFEKLFQILAVFAVLLLVIRLFLRAQEKRDARYRLVKMLDAPGAERACFLTVDLANRRLFMPGQVLPLAGEEKTAYLHATDVVVAMAIVPGLNRGFVTEYGQSFIRVFDLDNLATSLQLTNLPFAPGQLVYDGATHRLLVFDRQSARLLLLHPATFETMGIMELPGMATAVTPDEHGLVWIALAGMELLIAVDPLQATVVQQWPLPAVVEALAVDAKRRYLFAGGSNGNVQVIDVASRQVVNTIALRGVPVDLYWDADRRCLIGACSDGALSVTQEQETHEYVMLQQVLTYHHCYRMTVDPLTQKVAMLLSSFDNRLRTGDPGKVVCWLYWNQ